MDHVISCGFQLHLGPDRFGSSALITAVDISCDEPRNGLFLFPVR